MKTTNIELKMNCERLLRAKTAYMWGCYGQKLTAELIMRKAKQYPNRFSAARQSYLLSLAAEGEHYGCDCVGLIKNCLWGGFGNKLIYDGTTDFGTEGLRRMAKTKGDIKTIPETPGTVVYKPGHVGVYLGEGRVIECTLGGRGDGVVETPLKAAGWTEWMLSPEIEYLPEAAPKPAPVRKKTDLPALRRLFGTRLNKIMFTRKNKEK